MMLNYKKKRFRIDVRKDFPSVRGMRHWNKLPREVADARALKIFKFKLVGL